MLLVLPDRLHPPPEPIKTKKGPSGPGLASHLWRQGGLLKEKEQRREKLGHFWHPLLDLPNHTFWLECSRGVWFPSQPSFPFRLFQYFHRFLCCHLSVPSPCQAFISLPLSSPLCSETNPRSSLISPFLPRSSAFLFITYVTSLASFSKHPS